MIFRQLYDSVSGTYTYLIASRRGGKALIIDPVLLVMAMGGSRFAYRVWKEHTLGAISGLEREPVVVIGAEDAACCVRDAVTTCHR